MCATLAQDAAKGLQSQAPVVSQTAFAPAQNAIARAQNAIARAQNAIAPAQPVVVAAIPFSYKRNANDLTASPLKRSKDLASTKATKRRRVDAACAASMVSLDPRTPTINER